jgi:aldehyde:ferredoxin oxidoreductase
MADTARLFSCVMGKTLTPEELMEAGDRIWNLERLFNIREGFTREDDTLPQRLLQEPMPEGPAKGHIVELDQLLDDYYRTRNWENNGVPTREVLDKLGLAEEGRSILPYANGDR